MCGKSGIKNDFKVVDIFHSLALSLFWQVLKMVKGVWFTIHFVMCFHFPNKRLSILLWPLFFSVFHWIFIAFCFLFGWFSLWSICCGDLFWVHLKWKGLTIRICSKGTAMKKEKHFVPTWGQLNAKIQNTALIVFFLYLLHSSAHCELS